MQFTRLLATALIMMAVATNAHAAQEGQVESIDIDPLHIATLNIDEGTSSAIESNTSSIFDMHVSLPDAPVPEVTSAESCCCESIVITSKAVDGGRRVNLNNDAYDDTSGAVLNEHLRLASELDNFDTLMPERARQGRYRSSRAEIGHSRVGYAGQATHASVLKWSRPGALKSPA